MVHAKLKALIGDALGATAIEYGLICALVAVGMIGGLNAVGGTNGAGWAAMSSKVAGGLANTAG